MHSVLFTSMVQRVLRVGFTVEGAEISSFFSVSVVPWVQSVNTQSVTIYLSRGLASVMVTLRGRSLKTIFSPSPRVKVSVPFAATVSSLSLIAPFSR